MMQPRNSTRYVNMSSATYFSNWQSAFLTNQTTGKKGNTPLNLYEGVAVGAALAIRKNGHLECQNAQQWLGEKELKKFTTGATNSRRAVSVGLSSAVTVS